MNLDDYIKSLGTNPYEPINEIKTKYIVYFNLAKNENELIENDFKSYVEQNKVLYENIGTSGLEYYGKIIKLTDSLQECDKYLKAKGKA